MIAQWLDERLGAEAVRTFLKKKSVPLHRYTLWYYLGGMTLFLFAVQVLTGILLMLYYRPSADEAFESVQFIMTTVPFGWLIRSIHSWSANVMIGLAFVHMFSVFFLRAYRRPRELTWLSGVVLLVLALAFAFSGYLLPWNRLAFFATRVGTDIAGSIPLVGHWLMRFLRGGDHVTGGTLSRFYGWHVAMLPAITTVVLVVHLFLVQRLGMSLPRSEEAVRGPRLSMPFFPNFMLRDLVGWLIALACLATLAAIFPWELGEKADPFAPAFANIKPEWCFMFMFQTLKIVPGGEFLGVESESWVVLGFCVAGLVLLLVPFLDRTPPLGRDPWIRAALGWFAFTYILVMTAWGYHAYWLIPVAVILLAAAFFQHRFAHERLVRTRSSLLLLLALLIRAGLIASLVLLLLAQGAAVPARGQDAPGETRSVAGSQPSSCESCHRSLAAEDSSFAAPLRHWEQDTHQLAGVGCEACHGGNPDPGLSEDAAAAMDEDLGFVGGPDRTRQAEFCGRCHSRISYMRKFNPSARVDQVEEYRTSAHGIANASGDLQAATCGDCHGMHGILPVAHPNAPVYARNVPQTCARCHGDADLMAGRGLPTTILADYMRSVHADALFNRHDNSAPVCNDCHGNHGAAPPGVESVANVCGHCHAREAMLFRDSWKKTIFDDLDMGECSACHGHHEIQAPTLAMLDNSTGSVCMQCHTIGDEGYQQTGEIYVALGDVQQQMRDAEDLLNRAERAGVEVSHAIYSLKKEGVSALVTARTLIHTFDTQRLLEAADEARGVANESRAAGLAALAEARHRRIGLFASLALALLAIVALLRLIRRVDRAHPVMVERDHPTDASDSRTGPHR